MGMFEDEMEAFRNSTNGVSFGKSWIESLDVYEEQKKEAEEEMRNYILLMLAIITVATATEIFVLTSDALDLVEGFIAPLIAIATVVSLLACFEELRTNYREALNAVYSMIQLYEEFKYVLERKADEER